MTPGGAANELPGCSGTTRQPACLWLQWQREGPRATSQGCPALSLGGPSRSAVPFTGSLTWAASFLTFLTLEGREGGRAVGAVWEGRLGRLCSQRWKETWRTFPSPCICRGLELQAGEKGDSFVYSRTDGTGGIKGAGTSGWQGSRSSWLPSQDWHRDPRVLA